MLLTIGAKNATQAGFNVGYLYAYNNFLHIGLSFNKANAVKLANAVDVSGSTYLGLVTKANVNINKVNLYVYQEFGYQNSSVTINTPKLATNFATKIAVSGNYYRFSPEDTIRLESSNPISDQEFLKQLCIGVSIKNFHGDSFKGLTDKMIENSELVSAHPDYNKDPITGEGQLSRCGYITIKNGNTGFFLSDDESKKIMVDNAGKLYLTDANLYGINKKFNTSGFIYKIGFGGEYMVTKNLGVFVDLAYTYNIKQKEEVNIGKLENSSIASLGVSIKL